MQNALSAAMVDGNDITDLSATSWMSTETPGMHEEMEHGKKTRRSLKKDFCAEPQGEIAKIQIW